jgi:glycosyltransferase involved in cell wall biosynthesis
LTNYKICILTGAHLCRNPRVVKEANALFEAGYRVTVLTVWTNRQWLDIDRQLLSDGINYHGIDLTDWNSFKTIQARLRRKLFLELNRRFGLESVHSLNYCLNELYRRADAMQADLYIGHQETGLAVGIQLLKKGKKVAFDFEDWYSKDLLPEARKARPVGLLERLERPALHKGAYVTTTSQSMAGEMARYYGCSAPGVIRNVFPLITPNRRVNGDRLSLVWFSQTTGPGRGLEFMIGAINFIPDIPLDIHLRGAISDSYRFFLENQVKDGSQHRLFFHELVPPDELPEKLGEHDIGLALEMTTPESRNLTITNKIMQYLQAGLAVIATNTQGQREVAQSANGAITLVEFGNEAELADTIREFHASPDKLQIAKNRAVQASRLVFNWEIEKEKILALVEKAVLR